MKKNLIILIIFAILGLAVYSNALNNPFYQDDEEVIVKNRGIAYVGNIPSIFIDPGLSSFNKDFAGHYRPFVTVSYAIDYAIGGLNPVGYHLVNLAFHVGTAFLIFLIVKAMLGSTSEARSKKQEVRSKTEEARREQTEARSKTEEARSKKQDAGEQIPPGPPLLKGGNIMADPSFLKVGWGGGVFFAAIAAGLIFLVHPFNSEAVNYATARSSVMSGFFYLLAFLCWVKFRSKKQEARREEAEVRSKMEDVRKNLASYLLPLTSNFLPLDSYLLPLTSCFYLCSLFAFVAGMLSKEIVITLPVVLWLYDLYFTPTLSLPPKLKRRGGEQGGGMFNWRSYLTYIPFVAVIAAYMGIRHVLFAGMVPHFQRDLWTQFLTELPVLAGHWVLFLWPKNLTLIHYVEIYRSITWPVVLSFIFLALYILAAVYLWLKGQQWGRLISFFMVWFFIVLLPTSIVPLNTIFQENRGYLAIVGFVVLAGVVLGEISRRFGSDNRIYKPAAAFLIVLLIVYSGVTVKRNIVWGDSLLFWQDAIAKSPKSGIAYAGLASYYRTKDDLFLSIKTASKGVEIAPGSYHARVNLAMGYQITGNIDKAIEEYENAIKISPKMGFIIAELSALYIEKGNMNQAEVFIREALRKKDDSPHLYYHLGGVLTSRGDFTGAEEAFQKVISIYPDYLPAIYRLAGVFEKMGRHTEAINAYRDVVRIGESVPDLADISYGMNVETLTEAVEESRKKLDENRKQ